MILKDNVEERINDIVIATLPISSISTIELTQLIIAHSILDVSNNVGSIVSDRINYDK